MPIQDNTPVCPWACHLLSALHGFLPTSGSVVLVSNLTEAGTSTSMILGVHFELLNIPSVVLVTLTLAIIVVIKASQPKQKILMSRFTDVCGPKSPSLSLIFLLENVLL